MQSTLVLALLNIVLGTDFRIRKFGEPIFNIRGGGLVLVGNDYIRTFIHTSTHTDTRALCAPYLESSAPDFAHLLIA